MFKKVFSVFNRKSKGPVKPASSGSQAERLKREAAVTLPETEDPRELCGIEEGWTDEQVREHLAVLYKRHNAAASSLDETMREEAEIMLDAIVAIREELEPVG